MLNRRPLKSRSLTVFQNLAARLAGTSLTPNQISIASIGFALLGALALLLIPGWVGLIICALAIQLRLLCNLLDGMVAVEGGKKSVLGDLYNELPDRVSDSLLLVALGYTVGLGLMGWLAALLAMLTAYVRVLGGALNLPQDFRGPQSKSQRMAVLTGACLLGALLVTWDLHRLVLLAALVVITLGSLLTSYARLAAMAALLKHKARES